MRYSPSLHLYEIPMLSLINPIYHVHTLMVLFNFKTSSLYFTVQGAFQVNLTSAIVAVWKRVTLTYPSRVRQNLIWGNESRVNVSFFFSFSIFRASPMALEASQARDQIRSTAAGLHHSDSGTESHLWPYLNSWQHWIPDRVS